MIVYSNFKIYTPENNEMPELKIGYLISDEGVDWYECQDAFSDRSMKIGFDAAGVIRTYSHEVSMLWPVGLSVAEVAVSDVPEEFERLDEWSFDGKDIIPRRYTTEELTAQAESKKQMLMSQASTAIAPLQDAVDIGEATDTEVALLQAWKKYRILLNRIDTSTAPDIEWPVVPN